MAVLLDNKLNGSVGKTLRQHMTPGARLSLLVNGFSIYAFMSLSPDLTKLDSCRMLLPVAHPQGPSDVASGGHFIQNFASPGLQGTGNALRLSGDASDRRFRNQLLQARTAMDCAEWVEQKVEVRALRSPMSQNVYCLETSVGAVAIQGSSPFTNEGLGFAPSPGPILNTLITEPAVVQQMSQWFDGLWEDGAHVVDFKDALLNELYAFYKERPPEKLYYFTLNELFQTQLGDVDEDRIIRTRTGIKDTIIWNKLYRFQRDGVMGAIDKIERYNGCIIADSVGLGKTFEALAIIKYYELRNDRVLVLAPKKLRENWTLYTVNDRRNLLAGDRFNYDVLNHTDLTRTAGMSGEINLETLNWGNYDLVVIDESHNFRNNPSNPNGLTRYGRLMEDIIKSGVKTKVLMLSATPVNNRMNDLKNQVAFITEGADDALAAEGIVSIEETLRRAQARFNQWLRLGADERTPQRLLDSLNFDYFKLLDLLTIARSRKHIVKYYGDADTGRFPERAKPMNIKPDIDSLGRFPELREINRDIRRLNLSTYSPLKYVLPHKRDEYSRKYDKVIRGGSVFRQIHREENLIHLMRVNLLKRMESSIHSFALTVERLLNDVRNFIERLDGFEELEVGALNIADIEIDDEDFAEHVVGNKIKVLIQDVDKVRWKQELREDEAQLVKLLRAAREIDPERDLKLAKLKEEIVRKAAEPINPGNRKLLIFTAFADTAEYLYENVAEWAQRELGLHTALVTGGSGGNKTTMPGIRKDIGSVLTSFSPVSMERDKVDPDLVDEIDILIATDCISEGQNLQDCDCVINYDIHWNPVAIIQRFGRIDRIGSRNAVIQLINFWPNLELDEYINLEARVSGRMTLLDISATGEENIIEQDSADQMNDLEYRRRQLEQLQNEIVDLEDLSNGISITDLTLSDFRMDLLEYRKEHGDALRDIPFGVFSVTNIDDVLGEDVSEPGVIFCLRHVGPGQPTDTVYGLAPYYLVYIAKSGRVVFNFTHTRKILEVFRNLTSGRSRTQSALMATLYRRTRRLANMGRYRELLAGAVQSITGDVEERGVASLFERGGTVVNQESFRGIDDFEVVAYLIIAEDGAKASGVGA